jgi:transposase InsO family protein
MQLTEKDPKITATQSWKTFIANHAHETWACDFVQTYDLFFGIMFIFFIIEIGSRRVVHFNVTRHPTDQWVGQQLREATPYDTKPRFLIRDNDTKFGQHFTKVATGAQIEILRTPIQSPKANAYCERFIGSVRREFLDHVFILREPFAKNDMGIRGLF